MTAEPEICIAPGVALPPIMVQRFRNAHGRQATDQWLGQLASTLRAWLETWEVELERVEPPDTFNIVLFGASRRAGDVVLKLSPPTFESRAELAAVSQTSGPGFARLIDADPTISLMMLERIRPGTELAAAGLADEEATRICATKLLDYWREPADATDLVPLERWAKELLEYNPAAHPHLPTEPLATGKAIAHELLSSPRSQLLLHGDLHHQNILQGPDGSWITIDPKGLVGERGYDIASWMMNPWGFPERDDYVDIGNRRLDILAEALDEDRERLAKWAVFHAALSLCWSLDAEQPENPEGDIAFLRTMLQLLD